MSGLLDLLQRTTSPQERFAQLQSISSMTAPPMPTAAAAADTTGAGTDGLTFGVQDSYYSGLAQSLYDLIEQRFPEVSMGGIFNPRNIAGTNTPSEHAYGAAVDLMVGSNNLGDLIYKFLNRPRIEDRFGYSNVLWERPDHWNHLHVGWLY
jgi:hypothetical protein